MDSGGTSGDRWGAHYGRKVVDLDSARRRATSRAAERDEETDLLADVERLAGIGTAEWLVADDRVFWSEAVWTLLGLAPRAEPMSFDSAFAMYLDRVHPDDQPYVSNELEAALSTAAPFSFQHRLVGDRGGRRSVRCRGESIVNPLTGKTGRVVCVLQVATAPPAAGQPLARESQYRGAFDHAPHGMAIADFSEGPEGRLTEVNEALSEVVGRSRDDLLGSTLAGLCLDEDAEIDLALRERLVAGEIDRFSVEKRALLAGDRVAWLQLSVASASTSGLRPHTGIVQIQNVTERKRFEEELRHVADHDSLTGLVNRRRFRDELDSHLALMRRYGGSGALLLVDVDRLKHVNDTRGHGAGDIALRRVAESMKGRVRATDIVARLAGDEFAVLLHNTAPSEALALGEALITRLAEDEVADWGVSISVGVAPFGEDDTRTSEEVMEAADAAMYGAKRRGGAVSELAEQPSTDEGSPESTPDVAPQKPRFERRRLLAPEGHAADQPAAGSSLVDRVRAALREDGLVLYQQPVIDLRSGRVAHRELLVRMIDSESGDVVAASGFLAAASRASGLCAAIDAWVVERALAELGGTTASVPVQVNLSAETVADEAILQAIASQVAASGADPSAIGFEIGEVAIGQDMSRAGAALAQLAATGCPLVLDGFSAGFGSFDYLERLPLAQVKIDASVVRGVLVDDARNSTMRAMVHLARGTGCSTVAKVVDAPGALPLLRLIGVDMAQGFELARPEPVSA